MLDMQARVEPYTVRIIALTDFGIPLVSDRNRIESDRLWKFPGGGSKAKDRGFIFNTARREMRGETCIELDQETCVCIAHIVRKNGHNIYLVFNKIQGPVNVPQINVDNENVKIYRPEGIFKLIQEGIFLRTHLELLQKASKDYQRQVLEA